MQYITAIKNDDTAAFEKVYLECYEKLYFFYLRKTQSQYIAEELAQETFIKLWIYRKSLSEDIPIAAQVFRIARTTFIDALKKKKLAIVSLEEVIPQGSNDIEGALVLKEFSSQVQQSIEALPPIRRKVFKLSREGGLSHNEIADMLSISPKSVNNHITKALQQIKKTLVVGAILLVTGWWQ